MQANTLWIIIYLGIFINFKVLCNADADKAARATKSRLRSSHSPWRLVVCLSQSQTPSRMDVQRAWEEVRMEASQSDIEVSYVEARSPMSEALMYPLSLINTFCNDIENGKTVLSLVIGGGSAARFLITAAASLNLPALWLPMTHRDFLRQVSYWIACLLNKWNLRIKYNNALKFAGKAWSIRDEIGNGFGGSWSCCSCIDAQGKLARVYLTH